MSEDKRMWDWLCRLAKALKCLPSTFVDGNEHIVEAAVKLQARIAELEEKLRIKDDVITAKGLLIEALQAKLKTWQAVTDANQQVCKERDLLQAKLTATEQKLAKHRWIPVDEGLPHDTKKIIWDFLATTKGTGTIALFKWHPGHCSYVEVNRDCLPMSRDEIKDEFDKWKPITLPEGD